MNNAYKRRENEHFEKQKIKFNDFQFKGNMIFQSAVVHFYFVFDIYLYLKVTSLIQS